MKSFRALFLAGMLIAGFAGLYQVAVAIGPEPWFAPTPDVVYSTGDYVGINTATPVEALDVVGNIKATGTICDANGCIGAGGGQTPWAVQGNNIGYQTGNVGIGTTDPQEPLHVTGNIRLSGSILSDQDICIGQCN